MQLADSLGVKVIRVPTRVLRADITNIPPNFHEQFQTSSYLT